MPKKLLIIGLRCVVIIAVIQIAIVAIQSGTFFYSGVKSKQRSAEESVNRFSDLMSVDFEPKSVEGAWMQKYLQSGHVEFFFRFHASVEQFEKIIQNRKLQIESRPLISCIIDFKNYYQYGLERSTVDILHWWRPEEIEQGACYSGGFESSIYDSNRRIGYWHKSAT